MLGPAAMLGAAAGQGELTGPGPDGPPTNVSVYNAGNEPNPRTGIQWTNGDVQAQTASGFSTDPGTEPTGQWITSPAGITSQDTTDDTAGRYWWVRHLRNGQFSAWVLGGNFIP